MLLDFRETKKILGRYDIPMPPSKNIDNIQEGIGFAQKFGWPASAKAMAGKPVVLKLLVPGNLHKIDKGLVKLNIQNERELKSAYKDLIREGQPLLKSGKGCPSQVLIQRQVEGTEIFIGMKRDKSFGPVISFGLGGIFLEVLGDVVFGLCPLSQKEAMAMVKKIKGYKILQGYRTGKPLCIKGIVDIVTKVSRMAEKETQIQEIDFNPIFVNQSSAIVADPKIIC